MRSIDFDAIYSNDNGIMDQCTGIKHFSPHDNSLTERCIARTVHVLYLDGRMSLPGMFSSLIVLVMCWSMLPVVPIDEAAADKRQRIESQWNQSHSVQIHEYE